MAAPGRAFLPAILLAILLGVPSSAKQDAPASDDPKFEQLSALIVQEWPNIE